MTKKPEHFDGCPALFRGECVCYWIELGYERGVQDTLEKTLIL